MRMWPPTENGSLWIHLDSAREAYYLQQDMREHKKIQSVVQWEGHLLPQQPGVFRAEELRLPLEAGGLN